MKYIRTFETLNNYEDLKINIQYLYITHFLSEDDFDIFCMEYNNVDNVDDINFDFIPNDIIVELNLRELYPNVSTDELREIIIDIISQVDLDDCDDIREMSLEDYKILLNAEKYNL